MRLRLFPRQKGFYDLFTRSASNAVEGARIYLDLCQHFIDPKGSARLIREKEHIGDEITHETIRALNTTFVTPIDREDIHGLATSLDDIMDHIEAAADMCNLHHVEAPTSHAIQQAELLVRMCESVASVVDQLRKLKGLENQLLEIHEIENEGDRIYRSAIADLYNGEHKAMDVLKWQTIYDQVERAIDRCEDVANRIEAIMLKHT